jgi:hypothetical protein
MLTPVTCTLSGLIGSTVISVHLNSRCYLVLSCNLVVLCTALDVTCVLHMKVLGYMAVILNSCNVQCHKHEI